MINARHDLSATSPPDAKLKILLMDANAERRALRKRAMAFRGAEVIAGGSIPASTFEDILLDTTTPEGES